MTRQRYQEIIPITDTNMPIAWNTNMDGDLCVYLRSSSVPKKFPLDITLSESPSQSPCRKRTIAIKFHPESDIEWYTLPSGSVMVYDGRVRYYLP
ncbi:hypothetical protein HDV02_000120 [Globomyces sp. JEL0801]|nr:hypothetical protein HDV02_000120 [Globomyces sp. JEL0801]